MPKTDTDLLTPQQRKWFTSVREGLERETGKSLAEWVEIAKACPGCQVTDDFTLPQMLGRNLVPAVVSAAKRIGGLKYIISVNGAFTDTLPEALKAAGLRGNQLATVSGPFILGGWQTMDMAVRSVMKLPPSPGDNVVPWVLLKKSNIGTPSDSYDVRPTTRACSRSSGTSADDHGSVAIGPRSSG